MWATRASTFAAGVVEVAEQRDVHRLDRQLAGRVLVELVGRPEVDDPPDAVGDERLPAGVAEPARVVGAHDRAEAGRPAARGRQAAEVADVDAAVPDEHAAHAGVASSSYAVPR